MNRPARILIVAGEASGDLYGGLLMREMQEKAGAASGGSAPAPVPPVRFDGIGGDAMREAGLTSLADASILGVTGFVEVASRFGAIWRAYRGAKSLLRNPDRRPDLAILIDYPDFNLRLAAHARAAGVPVLYFISPQVWAWRRGRVRTMAGRVDRMLVILPFEEEIYRAAGVPVTFVGHPLLDQVRTHRTRRQERARLGLDPDRPLVALLPGSRRNEIAAHLPPLLDAFDRLREEFRDLQALITVAPTRSEAELRGVAQFLAFLSQPQILSRFAKATGFIPATNASFEAMQAEGFFRQNAGRDVPYLQLTRGTPTANSAGYRFGRWTEIRDFYHEEIERALQGQQTAQQALDNAVRRGNEALRQFERAVGN